MQDVFVRDLIGNVTALVSVNAVGTTSGSATSLSPEISSDGRFVLFSSDAGNLVSGDANGTRDVFVRDLQTNTTFLASINSAGTGSGTNSSDNAVISSDGRYVAFTSSASDLVANDTNGTTQDVFVRDLVSSTTTLVSLNSAGTGSGSSSSSAPTISGSARFVVFVSNASNLVGNDTNGSTADIFVRDLQSATTTLVSVNSTGSGSGDNSSSVPVISGDGSVVAFNSTAGNLIANDNNGAQDVFVRTLATSSTSVASVAFAASASPSRSSTSHEMSADGRYITYLSNAGDIVTSDTNGQQDAFVFDHQTGATTLVSVNSTGSGSGNAATSAAVISADGRSVAFVSSASNLTANDTNGSTQDVFVRDLQAATTNLVSLNNAGTGSGNSSSSAPSLSSDGRFVAFVSNASNLASDDSNGSTSDVFVRDVQSGTTTLLSRTLAGTGSGNATSDTPFISGNGQLVAFRSASNTLIAGDFNGKNDVFAASVSDSTLSATIVGNDLVIEDVDGTGKNNALSVSRSDANLVISDANEEFATSISGAVLSNSNKTITVPVSALGIGGKIIVKGQGGNDSLNVDVATDLGFDVQYQGGTGTSDSLTLAADSVISVTHTFTNANDGSITIVDGGSRVITYTGLEPITDNLIATDRVFTFNGGAETITLSDATGSTLTIDSTLSESVTFANPTSSLTINAGSGDDVVTIASVGPVFRAALTIQGGDEFDFVNVNANLALGSTSSAGDILLAAEEIHLNAANIATDGDTNNNDAGSVTLDGAVTLGTDVTIDTGSTANADGDIIFTATVNAAATGAQGLTLQPNSGDVTLRGVGTTARLEYLDVVSIGTVHLAGDILTDRSAGGSGRVYFPGINFEQGDVVLDASVAIDTGNAATNGGEVNFYGAVISADVPGRDLLIDASPNTGGFGIVLRGFGNQGGAFLNDLTLNVGTNDIKNYGHIRLDNAGPDAGDLTLLGPGTFVVFGASETLDTEQGNDGPAGAVVFGPVTIGSVFALSDLSIDTSTTASDQNAGNIALSQVSGITNLSLSSTGALAANHGTIRLDGNVTTLGSQTFNGPVVLGTDITLDNSAAVSGNIVFADSVNAMTTGTQGLSVNAGSHGVSLRGVGSTVRLEYLDVVSVGTVHLAGDILTDRSAGGSGLVAINGTVIPGGALTPCNIVLNQSVVIDTESGDANAGTVNFIAGQFSASTPGLDLTIDTSSDASHSGGLIVLGYRGASNDGGAYLNDLMLSSGGGTGSGDIWDYGHLRLDANGTDTGDFTVLPNSGVFAVANLGLVIDTEQGNDGDAGHVNFGTSAISSFNADSQNIQESLVINTSTTAAGKHAGNITFPTMAVANAQVANLTLDATSPSAANDGTVTFNGAVAIRSDGDLIVNAGKIQLLNATADLATTGDGIIALHASRNIALELGSSLVSVDGDILLEANQQATASSGQFAGIEVDRATIDSTSGRITVKGRGGDNELFDPRHGVALYSSTVGQSTLGNVVVEGTGGNRPGNANIGVYVDASTITSGGGDVHVIGHGGGTGAGSDNNYGVYVFFRSHITAGGSGSVLVEGIGGNGSGAGGNNFGVFLNANSSINSSGTLSAGDVSVTGIGGFGATSSGIRLQVGGEISTSTAGNITLTADSIDLHTAFGPISVNAQSRNVTIRPTTTDGSIGINLGGADSATELGLTDEEFDQITAGTVRIGDSNSGAITVSTAIDLTDAPTIETLHLSTNATVDGPLVGIKVPNLAVTAGGAVVLGGFSNPVELGTLAVHTTSGGIVFVVNSDLIVGSVDGVNGLATSIGNIEIHTSGSLTVNQAIDTESAFSLDVRANDALLTINAPVSAAVSSALIADKMDLNATVSVTTGRVDLVPEEIGDHDDEINIGSTTDAATNTLELSAAELDLITATLIGIGSNGTNVVGPITISAPISVPNAPQLVVFNSGPGSSIAFLAGASLAASQHVGLSTGGAIVTDAAGVDVTSASLNIVPGADVGSVSNPLRTSVDRLSLLNATDVDLYVAESDTLALFDFGLSFRGFDSTLHIMSGTFLLIPGDDIVASNTIEVVNGTLGGIGTTHGPVNLLSGGSIAPGMSPGLLNTGSVSFTSGSNFNVELNGTSVGTQYDQLNVIGSVNLGGATLNVTLGNGFNPANGNSFTIINNDGNDAIFGTFNGLVEGATISNLLGSGHDAVINYSGGDGNDVVLTVQPRNLYWLGTSGSNWNSDSWTNISGGIVVVGLRPENSDRLLFDTTQTKFHDVAASYTVTNDLSGLSLFSLKINDASASRDFSLSGNSITLSNGLSLSGTTAFATIGFSQISLSSSQTFSGNGSTIAALTMNSPINVGSATVTLTGGAYKYFNGAISGAGGLTFSDSNDTFLNTVNTYSGPTQITRSIVGLQLTGTFGDTTSGTTVTNGAVSLSGVSNGDSVTLSGSGAELRGRAGATQIGNVTLATTGTSTLWNDSGSSTFTVSGNITGTQGLTIDTGAAGRTVLLTGTNSYSGTTFVRSAGRLLVDGSLANTTNVTVESSATLGGTGAAAGTLNVQSGGTVAPGLSPGLLSTGSVSFTSGSNFNVEFNGMSAGTQYDRLNVTGTVNLGGATLNTTLGNGFTPANSGSFTIINNDGSEAIIGTFNGYSEGSTVMVGGVPLTISYHGGDGNDVVIIADATRPAVTAITRNNPTTNTTDLDSVVFGITFSEPVTNVSADDFVITGTTATGVLAGSGRNYTLTVSGGNLPSLNGPVGVNLAAGQNIIDFANNALNPNEPATDEIYDISNGIVFGNDRFEENESFVTATELGSAIGSTFLDNLSMHSSTDQDFYRFQTYATGTASDFVRIDFTHSVGDLDLALYDASGNSLRGSAGTTNREEISLSGLPAGIYFVQVIGFGGARGNYSFAMNTPQPTFASDRFETNNSTATATNFGTITAQTSVGDLTIHSTSDQDYFKFTTVSVGSAEHFVRIDFNHLVGDLDLELLNSAGNAIRTSGGITSREEISLTGLAIGTYYLRVLGFSGALGRYSLTANTPTPTFAADRFEANNTTSAATNLGTLSGTSLTSDLTIHSSSDQDYFKFTTQNAGVSSNFVRIDYTQSVGDLDLQLLDAAGNVLATSGGVLGREDISLAGRTAGTYFVRIVGYSGSIGSYQLTIESPQPVFPADRYEANNSLAAATNLGTTSGQEVLSSLTIHSRDDRDYYKFTIPSKGVSGNFVRIDFTHSAGDLDMKLLNAAGDTLATSSGTTNREEISLSGRAAGTYIIHVYGYDGARGNYSLTTNSPVASGGLLSDRFEANNTFATATNFGTLTGNSSTSNLTIHATDDQDYFKFTTAAAGVTGNYVRIDFTHANGDLDMQLLDASGSVLVSSTGAGNREEISLAGRAAGTYAIRVFGYLGARGTYSMGLNLPIPVPQIPSDIFEPNNSRANATNLREVAGEVVASGINIHNSTDEDFYKFTTLGPGQAANFVRINLNNAQGDLDLQLLDAAGAVLGTSNGAANQHEISLNGRPRGTYFVRVYGKQGATNPTYSVTVNAPLASLPADAREPNDTLLTATDFREVVGLLTESNLSIHAAGNGDVFKFETVATGTAADQVSIAFANAQGDLDLELYDINVNLLASSATANNSEQISLQGRPAGTYFMYVYGYNNAINPSYSLSIQAPALVPLDLAQDRLESNNTVATATDLRTLSGSSSLPDLNIHNGSDVDYFKFTTTNTGTLTDYVRMTMPDTTGDLGIELLASNGTTVLRTANGSSAVEELSLNGLTAGTYYVRAFGTNGARNSYQLNFATPLSGTARDSWTIMVYMTASNLQSYALADINEMEVAASRFGGDVNIAVLWDQSAAYPSYPTGNGTQAAWGTTGRGVIQGDTTNQVRTTFDLSIGEQDTGSATTLTNFINWATTTAPAEHYSLVMWDHGGGIYGFNYDNADGVPSDNLTTMEFVTALNAVPASERNRIDVVAFDACLMAMAEVSDSVSQFADYVVSSEEVIAGAGYDYRTAFSTLVTNPSATSAGVASGLVSSFQAQYVGGSNNSDTLSAVDATQMSNLKSAILAFSQTYRAAPTTANRTAITNARNASISFENSTDFRDLGQFMSYVASDTSASTALRTAAQNVRTKLDATIASKTNDRRRSSGLSIYLPSIGTTLNNGSYLSPYSSFLTATGWSSFLQSYLTGTAAISSAISAEAINVEAISERATTDFATGNRSITEAYDLRTLVGPGHVFSGLSLTGEAGEADWFRFTLGTDGTSNDAVSISSDTSNSPFQLTLFDSSQVQVGEIVTGTGSVSRGLAGLSPGEYFVRIETSEELEVSSYTLTIDAPELSESFNDWAAGNSSSVKASDLGILTQEIVFAGLSLNAGIEDWFVFQTGRNIQSGAGQLVINLTSPTATATVSLEQLIEGGDPITLDTDTGIGQLTLNYVTGNSATYRVHLIGGSSSNSAQLADGAPPNVRMASIEGTDDEFYSLRFSPVETPTAVTLPSSGGPFTLILNGAALVIMKADGTEVFRSESVGLQPLVITGTADVSDVLIIDYANGDPLPAGGLEFNGGAGGDDRLCVAGKGENAVYSPDATITGSGIITINDKAISFRNLEPVDLHGLATVTVSLPNADDVLTLSNGVDFTAGGSHAALRVSGTSQGVAIETLAVWDTTSLVINTTAYTDGNDTITVSGVANAHDITNLTINTGVGTDSVSFSGTATLAGDLTISTSMIPIADTVTAGHLSLDGDVAIQSGGTLIGPGDVVGTVSVQSGGTVSPSLSSGILNTGNLTLNSSSTLVIGIGGKTPGNEAANHDQLQVTGTVNLGNATLNLSALNGFVPVLGDRFTIIANDDDSPRDAVTGTFNGLPESGLITNFLGVTGLNAVITYKGGTGNDVELKVIPALCIKDVSVMEGDSGSTAMTFTVTLSNAVSSGFTVDYVVQDGTATVTNSDYVGGQAGSLRIGAFNGTRGGDFSLSDGSSAAAMKSLIQTTFPTATITDTTTLTAGFLANVDVVWLNSVFNNTTATSPLSGAEQTALLDFVNGGGRAIIFGENDAFDDSTLLAPFSAATTGNLVFLQTGTITNQSDVITNGPFGLVSTLQGNYSGTFTTLGAATPLGAWGNGGTSVAALQPGALSAGSGRVLLLSDVNYYADQLGAADNSKLLLNALSAMRTPPPHLTFSGTTGETHTITVTINGDLTNESDETLHVLLSNLVGNAEVTIADGDGLGTIENDDANGNAPAITSNGGGVAADLSVVENTTAVLTTVIATDATPSDTLTYSISGGADAAKFMLHPTNHELTFVATPDFENPTDVDLNNVYEVFVSVTDLIGNLDTQVLSVTVSDVQSTLSIDDFSQSELNSGMSDFTFTVTLSSAVAPFSVRYGTQNGTATVANNDYVGTAPGTLRVGAFDGSRGGLFSLSDGANAAAMKSLISSTFAGTTFASTPTLTTAFLSTVDVVWLNSVSGNTSATTPLSGAEQAALLAFVQNGGHALIFGENSVFEDESLLDPFSATTTGTLTDTQTGTITNATHPLTAASAPFGAVTTLQGFFPGNLSELGAATALGKWTSGNGTNVAVLDPGAISANSGRVVLLADVNFYADQLNNADNKKLLLNALASMVPASSVTLPFAGMANETQTIQVSVKGDTTLEGDETFRVLLGQLSGTNDVTIVKGTGVGLILNDDGGSRPEITSDLGGATAMKSVAENSTAVTTVIASDADLPSDTLIYSITGGADAAKFAIVPATGVLTFKAAPDFENPSDANHNNIYQVTVTVADAIGQLDSQALSVTVTDLQATLSIGNAQATEGSPLSFQVTLSNAIGTGFTVDYASQDGTGLDAATVAGGDYVAVTAGNLRIGAFDGTRGGIFSLSNGSSAAAMRALITSSFSGVTFVGTGTLTPAFLSSVDVVWLNGVSSNTSTTSALSAAEQSALLAFVQTGGHAMIFGENSVFDDESLLDPFSATSTGTLAGIQAGSITNTTHVLTAAGSPFGAVTSLQGNFSGKFNDTDLGMATQLGVWTSAGVTNNTSVAVIDPGVLATNSGRVVLFSDVNFYSDQLNVVDNSKLLLNALATMLPPAPLAFTGTQSTPEVRSITVTTNTDALSEGDETLNVLLGTLSGNNDVTITQATGQGTIHDGPSGQHNVSAVSEDSVSVMINDVLLREGNSGSFKAVFTVQLSEVSDETVTVRYATVNATATSGVDYKSANGTLTFAPGQTTKTFTILVTGDKLAEATESFGVHFECSDNADLVRDTAQVTIVDNDPVPSVSINNVTVKEGTGSGADALFTVKLSKASGAPVTVHYASLNGTAAAGSDYDQTSGTLTFAPGQTSQTVKVHVTGDSLHEANETFQVLLSDATNATIRTSTGKGSIKNDDKAPSLSIGDVTVVEGNIAVFTVVLSAPSGQDVTVKYATANGSAKANQDYTAASGTLTFAAGETTKTVSVNVGSTDAGKPNKQFAVNLSSPLNALFSDRKALATIFDHN